MPARRDAVHFSICAPPAKSRDLCPTATVPKLPSSARTRLRMACFAASISPLTRFWLLPALLLVLGGGSCLCPRCWLAVAPSVLPPLVTYQAEKAVAVVVVFVLASVLELGSPATAACRTPMVDHQSCNSRFHFSLSGHTHPVMRSCPTRSVMWRSTSRKG